MKRKLGIIAEAIKNEDSLETLDRIANAGFKALSPEDTICRAWKN